MADFEGRVAIVTGAGGGIGRCHALELARRGAKVVVNDLGGNVDGSGAGDAADRVVAEIRAAGGTAIANKASVADKAGAKSIVQDAVNAFGTVDILVNNAGILRDKTFKNMTLEEFDIVMQVHMHGTAYVTHAAWPIMLAQNYGRIVFTSSGSGIFGNFGQSNYGAAKMAMVGFMNVLALEGASKNVRVNCLAPSAATRMTNTVPGRNEDISAPDPERNPALVTPAVLYMVSEDAPNGAIIHGGNGRFSRSQVLSNTEVVLGAGATYEDFMRNVERIMDTSRMQPRQRPRRGAPARPAGG
jgi:NAD(P)-dependent dehydrogenase (short-subunit alcohol dehydrogenase family)